MSYQVGAIVVIDSSGNVPWARITGSPTGVSYGTEMTKGANVYTTSGSGSYLTGYSMTTLYHDTLTTYHEAWHRTYFNCPPPPPPPSNCNCNCYC